MEKTQEQKAREEHERLIAEIGEEQWKLLKKALKDPSIRAELIKRLKK